MNLFATPAFLDVVARVYFPTRRCTVGHYAVGDEVFRLLGIVGHGTLTAHPFLDMHEPVGGLGDSPDARPMRWLPNVGRELAPLEVFRTRDDADGGAPAIQWDAFPRWDDYLELLRRRHVLRDDQRRRRRLEERVGPLTFAADDAGADVLPTAISWKSGQWHQRSGIDLFADPRHRRFFAELRARGLLRASTLRAGGRLLAVWLGAVHQRRWYGWIFGFDPDPGLARYSVGRQLLYPMLEDSHRAGHAEFDFSRGCEPYKLFFATHVRTVRPAGAPPLRYQLEWRVRDRLRRSPRVYRELKALRHAAERKVFSLRSAWTSSRADQRRAPFPPRDEAAGGLDGPIIDAVTPAPRIVYQQGDHVCTLFSSPEEQLAAAIDYIRQGLARGERCLYVCGEQTPAEFRRALHDAGIDVGGEEARGALVLLTKETGHLRGGSFSASRMISMLATAVEDALRDGFTGLCAAGDMTWLLDEAPGSEELAEYEALLNHFYKSHRALGLCQYNRRRLPAAILDHGIATHPVVRIEGPILLTNPFYELPETAARRSANLDGLDARIEQLRSGRPAGA